MHPPEEVHVVGGLEGPRLVIGAERALAAHVGHLRDEKAELGQREQVEPEAGCDRVACERTVLLVRGHRDVNQLDKVVEVGLRFVEPLQLVDREPELDALARAVSVNRGPRAVGVTIARRARHGRREHALVRVRHREFSRRASVHLAD